METNNDEKEIVAHLQSHQEQLRTKAMLLDFLLEDAPKPSD